MRTSQETIRHGRELLASAHEQWQAEERVGVRPVFFNGRGTWELSTANDKDRQMDPIAQMARAASFSSLSDRPITAYLHRPYQRKHKAELPTDFKLNEDHFLDFMPEIQEKFWTCDPSNLLLNVNSRSRTAMADNHSILSAGLRTLSNKENKAFDGSVFTFNIGNSLLATIHGQTAPDLETVNIAIRDIGATVRQRRGDVVLRCDSRMQPSTYTAVTVATEQYGLSNGPFPESHRYLSEQQEAYLIGRITSQLLYTSGSNFTETPADKPVRVQELLLEPSDETAFDVVEPLELYIPSALRRIC